VNSLCLFGYSVPGAGRTVGVITTSAPPRDRPPRDAVGLGLETLDEKPECQRQFKESSGVQAVGGDTGSLESPG
jgi:hypothetical protein